MLNKINEEEEEKFDANRPNSERIAPSLVLGNNDILEKDHLRPEVNNSRKIHSSELGKRLKLSFPKEKQIDQERESIWTWKNEPLENPLTTKRLKILTITWNLNGKTPPENRVDDLLSVEEVKHHFIAVGTQECCRSILTSFLKSSKEKWESLLQKKLAGEYTTLTSVTLNAIHLIVFIHNSLMSCVKEVEKDSVATGVANLLGNKGAVGISFKFLATSFLFVSCHFASGEKNINDRNIDFNLIENNMNLPKNRNQAERNLLSERFDRVFWMGDFNYRAPANTKEEVSQIIDDKKFKVLLGYDQLKSERELGNIANGFCEGRIHFAPTYKLGRQENKYMFTLEKEKKKQKNRIPSWTDRILYKSKKEQELEQMNYESLTQTFTSDHRPVFAQFSSRFMIKSQQRDSTEGLVKMKYKSGACSIF